MKSKILLAVSIIYVFLAYYSYTKLNDMILVTGCAVGIIICLLSSKSINNIQTRDTSGLRKNIMNVLVYASSLLIVGLVIVYFFTTPTDGSAIFNVLVGIPLVAWIIGMLVHGKIEPDFS